MSNQKIILSAFLIQGLVSSIIAFSNVLDGLLFAWPSSTLQNFTSNNTVLSSPMSTIEVSLLGSLFNVGALLATPFCGYALRKFGRKFSVMLFTVPLVIAWTIILLTTYVPLVLTAVGTGGLGCAGYTTSAVYIAEISQDSIRGAFTSFAAIFFVSGFQLSYILAGYLTYYQIVYVYLSLSIIYIVLVASLKDSPVFLMQNGMEKEAAKSIAFYRRIDVKSAEVKSEMNKIKVQLNTNTELLQDVNNITEELLSHRPKKVTSKMRYEWNFLLKSESSKRALAACVITMVISLMMGSIVLQVYAEPLFNEAVPSMDSNKCAVYLGVDYLLGSVVSAAIVDKFGRKVLMTVSCAATGICSLLLGIQVVLHWAPHWCTVFLIYTYGFVYSLGAGNVPYVLPFEVFLPEVRGLCSSITLCSMWVSYFLCLFIFNPLVEAIGLGMVFCGFSIVCFLGAIYSQIWLPETKGLSAGAIQVLFIKNRS